MSELTLGRISFSHLPGWNGDQIQKTVPALKYSAPLVLKEETLKRWHPFYHALLTLNDTTTTEQDLRSLIVKFFDPYQLSMKKQFFHFTGYYEPFLKGSVAKKGPYQTPLYTLPPETVNFKIPRSQIVQGALADQGLELVWVDDPVAAFFLQIQGSGRIQLDNGTMLNIGYAGTNRHPYYAIGKTFVEKGIFSIQETSMQTISQWLRDHPDESEVIMSQNQSYVFFKIITGHGPIGTQKVPLTPERTLAVDPQYFPLGSLLWVKMPHPLTKNDLQRLVVAQDTGGVIKGPFRGDYFWGFGDQAEKAAGCMNTLGEAFIFLPKD